MERVGCFACGVIWAMALTASAVEKVVAAGGHALPADATNVVEKISATRPLTTFAAGESWWTIQGGRRAFQQERTPGSKPFAPPDEVIVKGACGLTCLVELVIWDSWPRICATQKAAHTYFFTGTWDRVSARFQTPLPTGVKYRLREVKLLTSAAKVSAAGGFSVSSIEGVYHTTQAGASRLDIATGVNQLHIARDDSERPEAVFANDSDRALHWRGDLRVADLFERRETVPFDITVPAHGTARVALPWPRAKGLWVATARITGDDGSQATRQTRFAVLDRHDVTPRLPKGSFRIGLNYHRGRYLPVPRRLCDEALVACGAKHSRQSIFAASKILPKEPGGPCDFSEPDAVIAEMHRLGIDVNVLMNYGISRDRLAELGEVVARHYGTELAYYEIGNEWELPSFFKGTTQDAIEIATTLARGFKKGCPEATVTLCGWASADDMAKRTVNKGIQRDLLQAARGLYDVHAMHLHGPFPSFRKRFVDVLLPNREKWGVTEPLYMNETAQTTAHADERDVAACVWKKIAFSWAYGSTDYIWYNLRATGYDPQDGEQGYGVMSADFYPRATYAALSAFTALFNGWNRPAVLRSDEDGECYCFAGARGGEREMVLLGWENGEAETMREIEVRTDAARAYLCDIMNNVRELPVREGTVTWPFGTLPGALRLVGATRAEPDAEVLSARRPKPVLVAKGMVEPAAVCDRISRVREYFRADPEMAHRVWQGPADCSVTAWFEAKGEGTNRTLVCRFAVTDDREELDPHADRMRLTLESDAQRWEFVFFRNQNGESGSWIWSKSGDIGHKRRTELWKNVSLAIRRTGTITDYDVTIRAEPFALPADLLGGALRVGFYAVDADGEGSDSEVGIHKPRALVGHKQQVGLLRAF